MNGKYSYLIGNINAKYIIAIFLNKVRYWRWTNNTQNSDQYQNYESIILVKYETICPDI